MMKMLTPEQIANKMLENDAFSIWMGIMIREIKPGYCCCEMQPNSLMLNGFSIAHGGIAFSLADSAAAFAANTHGFHALTLNSSTDFIRPVSGINSMKAIATEESRNGKYLYYSVVVFQNELHVLRQKVILIQTKEVWK